MDLLYTNGDNADYSNSLKRYHGIRLFQNDGNFKFRQVWFYPLYGATKAVARDFDGDGDLDVAGIAFYPDFSRNRPKVLCTWKTGAMGGFVLNRFARLIWARG
jgi:hypothetical protein